MIKNILFISFLSVLCMALLVSCAKKNTTPAGNNNNSYTSTFTATINGSHYTATAVSGIIRSGVVSIVSANAGDSIGFNILLTYTSPGTYQLNNSINPGQLVYINNKTSNTYHSTSGNIVVTSYANNVMIGTFQGYCLNTGAAQDSVSVTNGAFNIYIH